MWVVNNLTTFNKFTKHDALRKKRPYSQFFRSTFSGIWTEYRDLQGK